MTYGIVIASYRYGHLAGHCIETVLEQSRPFDRIWFVDDGAGDCEHLPDLYGYPKVEYYMNEINLGTVLNFQQMLDRVDTDMVMFLGADNWLRPDALELLIDNQEYSGSDVVICNGVVVGTEKKWAEKHFQSKPYQGGYLWDRKGKHHGSMLYNVEMGKKVGYFSNNRGNTQEDWNLFEGMVSNGAKVSWLPTPLLYYRRHEHNFNSCE